VTASATYYVVKALLTPDEPPNSGDYRPVRLIAPEGSLVNCRAPAPVVAANHETAGRIADVVMGAFAQAVPELAVAACSGTSGMLSVGGVRTLGARAGEEFVFVEAHGSGHGASARGDGLNATRASIGNTGNTPVEALEMAFPVQVECSEIVPDSGGPGRHRGGCGVQRRYRFLEDCQITITADRAAFAPYGLDGADAGLPSAFELTQPGGETAELPSKTAPIACAAGSTLLFRIAGGGGFGDPARRRRAATLADVRHGYVTAPAAAERYGVADAAEEATTRPIEEVLP
jgi:N-methylhydantoinase B